MMRARSASLYVVQCSISSGLRPQPEQSPEPGSTVQIFSQGDIITVVSQSDAATNIGGGA
jgi:hypothetical protein